MNFLIYVVVLIAIVFSSSCSYKDKQIKKQIKTDTESKMAYLFGYQLGSYAKKELFSKNEEQKKIFLVGVRDGLEGKMLMDISEMKKLESNLGRTAPKEKQKQKEKGMKFLEENKKKPGVKTTASGLQYKVLKAGEGKSPSVIDKVEVHYRGSLIDGTEFDSSYKRNKTITFPLNGVIKGWTEGLQLMKEGAKYEFYIPPELGYGSGGTSGIPPDSVLIFEVQLIKVQ